MESSLCEKPERHAPRRLSDYLMLEGQKQKVHSLVDRLVIETDARRFWDAMRERLQEFSLTLHPEKTRLIEFGRHAATERQQRGMGKPETFTFLGFTFICGKSRQGKFVIKRRTRRDRMKAKRRVVTGFFNYHAVPTNGAALGAFRAELTESWRRVLSRRSQRGYLTWARMRKLADDWLPKPQILHPWPSERFAVRHLRYEPYA
jgi:RNA-directed DNA polymerase